MPKMNVVKSIELNAPVSQVFPHINNLGNWTKWSPWLILEPEATVNVEEGGKYYEWNGARIGSGNMRVSSEKENEFVELALTFLKPWKSTSKVGFYTKEQGEGTEVTWTMDGSLPFFMFFMKKMMETFVGMDYDRGLRLLKDVVEDGEVHSKLDIEGKGEYPGGKYIGITTTTPFDKMGEAMSADFDKLWQFMDDKKDMISGNPFSQYHKWQMGKGQAQYTAGVPVKEIPANLQAGIEAGEMAPTKTYSVVHTGPYEHLGNAWSMMMNLQRAKSFPKKKYHPFEEYLNDPGTTDPMELKTAIRFGTK